MIFRYGISYLGLVIIFSCANASHDDNIKSLDSNTYRIEARNALAQAIPPKELRSLINDYLFDFEEYANLEGPPSGQQLAFSNNGKFLAQINDRRQSTLEIFYTQTKDKKISKLFDNELNSLSFSANDKYLAIAKRGDPSVIIILDVDENSKSFANILKEFKAHADLISSLSFSINERHLFSGAFDGNIKIWDLNAALSKQREDKIEISVFSNNNASIVYMDVSPDEKFIAAGLRDRIKILDIDSNSKTNGQIIKQLRIDSLISLKYSPNGKHLAAISYGLISIWDTVNYTIQQIQDLEVGAFDFSKNGKYLVSSGASIKIYDANTLRLLYCFNNVKEKNENERIISVIFSSFNKKNINSDENDMPNKYLACAIHNSNRWHENSTIKIWQLNEIDLD